jgi:hypothetical protein
MSRSVTLSKKPRQYKSSILFEILETPETPESTDTYEINRRLYSASEYFPSSLIQTIMQHHFPSSELVLSYNENHGIYKILIKDLLVDCIKNWEYNRPPDMARCPDIARYMYNSRKAIDTMIYLNFNNIKNLFEVLDGIHRLTSLNLIKEENSKELDLISTGEFGSNSDANWLYNQYILVNIRFNASLGELIEVFQNLNKSQVVPDLYIRDTKKEKRDLIDAIANEWYVRYKIHFSPSTNPNTGNTNRNKFVELLDKLYDKYKIDNLSGNKLRKLLEIANQKMSENISSKITISTRVRCKETGCYLFLYKNDKLEDII